MDLTLRLTSAAAAKLLRLPVVKEARTGRARTQQVRIVWHDTLDRALAARGQTLAEERGVWRLLQVRPAPTEAWPPATDHRVLGEAASADGLDHRADAPLVAVAAFSGRRTHVALGTEEAPLALTLLDGTLRAVTAEQPATRLTLDGPDAAVRALALALAEQVPIEVPERALAAEAFHLADGAPPKPRRQGPPDLPRDSLSTPAAFAHIVGHLAAELLYWAPLVGDPDLGPVPVHQMRVAVRRARSALSVFGQTMGAEALAPASDGLRTLARMLGPARDWDVFMTETLPPVAEALAGRDGIAALERTGTRRRRAARAELAAWLSGPDFRLVSLELACLAAAPSTADTAPPLPDFAAAVLRGRLKKLLHAGRALADLDDAGLHEVRLKSKRMRYAAEFFAPLFAEKSAARFIRRLAILQERLGVFNDTSVAETLLRQLGERPNFAAGLVLGFTAARGAGVRPRIAASWSRLRRRPPFWE